MEYKFQSITNVDTTKKIDSSVNLLIEQDSTIKRMNIEDIPQTKVQADWEETNENSMAYIKNKPDLSQVGGGNTKITYFSTNNSYWGGPWYKEDGSIATAQDMYDALKQGIVRINYVDQYYSDVLKYWIDNNCGIYYLNIMFIYPWHDGLTSARIGTVEV